MYLVQDQKEVGPHNTLNSRATEHCGDVSELPSGGKRQSNQHSKPLNTEHMSGT